MDEAKPEGVKKRRIVYKPKMGCLPKVIITLIIVVVLVVALLAIHYSYLKSSNPDLTVTDYLTFTWDSTKKTVEGYKEQVLAWKDWLIKAEKTEKWLDEQFPDEKESGKGEVVAAAPEKEGKKETEPEKEGSGETTEKEAEPEAAPEEKVHPEFQAAADEFRAGLVHFRNKENNEAYKRFCNAQDHIEAYRQTPEGKKNSAEIQEFEEQLAPFLHAAAKDSKL